MTKKKITEMSEAFSPESIDNSDIFTFVDVDQPSLNQRNKKVKVSVLKELFGGGGGGGEPYVEINSTEGEDDLPTATGYNAVAIGSSNHSPDSTGVSIGYFNQAGNSCVSVGTFCDTSETTSSIAIGNTNEVNANRSIVLGYQNTSSLPGSIAIGDNIEITAEDSLAFGKQAKIFTDDVDKPITNSLVMGNSAIVQASNAIAIGYQSKVPQTQFKNAGAEDAIAIGSYSSVQGNTTVSGGIAIGNNASTLDSLQSIAIGASSNIGQYSDYGVVLGHNTYIDLNGVSSIALGNEAWISAGDDEVFNCDYSIALGYYATTVDSNNIAIGKEAKAGSPTSGGSNNIAIGTNAVVFSNNSIQLGSGTNTTENTLQFQTNTIANINGLYTSFSTPSNYTPSNLNSVSSHLEAIDTVLSNNAEPEGINYFKAYYSDSSQIGASPLGNYGIAIGGGANIPTGSLYSLVIGHEATVSSTQGIGIGANVDCRGSGAIALGFRSKTFSSSCIGIGDTSIANGDSSISIGSQANVQSGSNHSIALGSQSGIGPNSEFSIGIGFRAIANASYSIQLGEGTNTTAGTLQYRNKTIANNVGVQVRTGAGAPTLTAADGTLYVDTSGLKLYFRASGQWIAAN